MGAVCGVVRFDGAPVARELGARIAARMAHRSPDGIRIQDGGSVALAVGSLHASRSACPDQQPARLPDDGWLVADGRIDDRRALASALGVDTRALAATGDAQLFASAWQRWREDLWRQVVGDYALAVWEPARGRLSLVRDRLGVRPLYWARTSSMLAFASEAEALLGIDGIPAEPNPDRVASNLLPIFDDGDRAATLYREVRRVMPAELLEVDTCGRIAQRRYWSFAPIEPLRLRSQGAYVEAYREVFDEAVRVRLDSVTTPSLMLSGGIDSAAVHASALSRGLPLRRVSVVADQPFAEQERANIEALLLQSPETLKLSLPGLVPPIDLPALVREVFEHAHPVLSSLLLPMMVNQAAAAAGSRAVLDGIDGDLVMAAPNNYIGRLALAGRPLIAWKEARAAAVTHTYLKHRPAVEIMAWAVASRLEPQWLAVSRYRLADARAGAGPYSDLLHPDLVASLRLRERTLEQRIRLRADPALRDWPGYRHWIWTNPGMMRGMEGFDLAAARFGLEARHPWCDQRVIDFFRCVPTDVVVQDGWTKHVARAAYAPQLGGVAWHSGKKHLGPQVTGAVLTVGAPWVDEALRDERGVLDAWIRTEELAWVRHAWRTRPSAASANDRILQLTTLAQWLSRLGSFTRSGNT